MIFLDSLGHIWLKICLNYFQNFNAKIKNQFRVSIKIWRSDNACEYFSKPLSSLLASQEILHESSCPDTTPQNSVDEQKNHLIETTRTMLIHYNVPFCFLNLCRRHILSSTLLFSSESTDVTSFLLKMFCNTLTQCLLSLYCFRSHLQLYTLKWHLLQYLVFMYYWIPLTYPLSYRLTIGSLRIFSSIHPRCNPICHLQL